LTSIALRTVASLAVTFALLALRSSSSRASRGGDLIGVPAGILVLLVVVGLVWTARC
jgi:hypothetical protein